MMLIAVMMTIVTSASAMTPTVRLKIRLFSSPTRWLMS